MDPIFKHQVIPFLPNISIDINNMLNILKEKQEKKDINTFNIVYDKLPISNLKYLAYLN